MDRLKPRHALSAFAALLLTAGLSLAVAGCMGLGGGSSTAPTVRTTQTAVQQPGSSQTGTSVAGLDAEALSTFKSKDPFIQQAVPTTTTSTTSPPPPLSTTTTSHGHLDDILWDDDHVSRSQHDEHHCTRPPPRLRPTRTPSRSFQ